MTGPRCVLFGVVLLLAGAVADDVVGCGGFVKVSAALKKLVKEKVDYSSIQVRLFTSEGLLKYSTECAPNGYYFIPIYDRGSFSLQIQGPEGWSFEQSSYDVVGENNICSAGTDVNFHFTGFRLHGKVVGSGQCGAHGAENVKVTATDSAGNQREAVSNAEGVYAFDNVLPGEYELVASHDELFLTTSSTKVTMKWGNHGVASNFVVSGYGITGAVLSSGEALVGVEFHLFSEDVSSVKCAAGKIGEEVQGRGKSLCAVLSDASGEFSFDNVPCGSFTVVPRYHSAATTFDVAPREAQISVQHGSYTFEKAFQVTGFTVSGRVVDGTGSPVEGAAVLVDGKEKAVSGADGSYVIDHVKAGDYTLSATKDLHEFADVAKFRVSPSVARLPDIVVSAYSLCGRIAIDQEGVSLKHVVVLEGEEGGPWRTNTDEEGKYCFSAAPGTYHVSVVLSRAGQAAGVLVTPALREVVVTTAPVLDASFFQARVTLAGTVKTIEKSAPESVTVTLTSADTQTKQTTALTQMAGGGAFEFANVLPGSYKVSINQEHWCWAEKSVEVNVETEDLKDIAFVQKGYLLSSVATHPATLYFNLENSAEDSQMSFPFNKGTNRFCLLKPGVYNLTPKSCYKFEKDQYKYSTAVPKQVDLAATARLVEGTVVLTGPAAPVDVKIVYTSSDGVVESVVKAEEVSSEGGTTTLSYSYWAPVSAGPATLEAWPSSPALLFYPRTHAVELAEAECPPAVPAFASREGLYLAGRISPAIEGVSLTVTAKHSGEIVKSGVSDKEGKYRVGPLYDDQEYDINAEKAGYFLEKEQSGFSALKLAEVHVHVKDQKGNPVAGVLISLSADGYRLNNATDAEGRLAVIGLKPGSYYARPQLKEYVFEPAAESFDVLQGETSRLNFAASRVAYSVYGTTMSLSGSPEHQVTIEAIGADNHEETQSDSSGQFRLRGLKPGAEYTLRVSAGAGGVERASPAAVSVTMKDADVHGQHFLVFKDGGKVDITGVARVDERWVKNVKVGLFAAGNPEVPIHEVEVGETHYFDFFLLPRDEYFLQMTTTLSRRLYDYSAPKVAVDLTSHRVFYEVSFEATGRAEAADIANTPFYMLSLGVIALYTGANYRAIASLIKMYQRRGEVDTGSFDIKQKKTKRH